MECENEEITICLVSNSLYLTVFLLSKGGI